PHGGTIDEPATRVTANTSTRAAPPATKAFVAASAVAPVVITSSSNTTLRPASAVHPALVTLNAPRRFSHRAEPDSVTCGLVSRILTSAVGNQRTPDKRDTSRASSAD